MGNCLRREYFGSGGCPPVRRTPSLSLVEVVQLRNKIIAHQVEENRRGEAQRIDAIQNAAPSLDHPAKILDADVALYRADHHPPGHTPTPSSHPYPRALHLRA